MSSRSVFEILNGIFQANPQSDFYAAIGGRMYLEEAPEDVQHPYCVLQDVGGQHTQGFCYTIGQHAVVFAIYDRQQTPEPVLAIGQYARDLFEYQTDTTGSPKLIGIQYGSDQLNRLADENRWEYLLGFTAIVDNE